MARQATNDAFLKTSFLDGANASYIEDLYARYQSDPGSVSSDWQEFFAALKEKREDVIAEARGASWQRTDGPITANSELVAALVGNWLPTEPVIGKK
ncbi:MAG: hypothetical protein KDJ77_15955, partial [Rhodobiaceae bacterium]|nr:hypothetical protein [Rhodobiaceae bacterium]